MHDFAETYTYPTLTDNCLCCSKLNLFKGCVRHKHT